MADNSGGIGMGLIVGILLVALIGVGILFATDTIDLKGGKDVDVNIELPKAPATGEK